MHRQLRRLSAPALAASLLLAACGSGSESTAATDTTGATAGTATSSAADATASTATSASAATSAVSNGSAAPASTTAAAEQRVEITFANNGVVGGPKTTKLTTGKPVVVVIRSDVAEEIHLHGYDLEVEVEAGTPAELRFEPDIPGLFEIEFHGSGQKLGELEIR